MSLDVVNGAPPPQPSATLWDCWQARAQQTPYAEAIVHWVAGEEPFRWHWAALLERARQFTAWLADRGVRPGDTCALVLRHDRDVYPLYMGVVGLGALPAALAYPNPRLHPDKFRHGLIGMAQHSGLDWLLTERALEPVVGELTQAQAEGGSIRGLLCPFEMAEQAAPAACAPPGAGPDDPCLLQHSSGTTGLQKAVVLSHRAVLEHARRYATAIALAPADRIVSWLPLYHDMGLMAAFHLPLLAGIPTVQLDPFEWVLAPVLLLEAVWRESGTLVWLPNFAYNFLADRVQDVDLDDGLRLDSLRMVINCSEPVRADSHARFLARFAERGLQASALAASYAMAEATFCVTQTPPGQAARQVRGSRAALAAGRLVAPRDGEPERVCVSSGAPLPGCRVRVIDEHGRDLPDGHVGELVVQSVCLFDGYRGNPAATAAVLRDGWYTTGDYGFLYQGECYVVGRKKDIIIVAGKNLYPEDIEAAVAEVPGVTPGRLLAIGVPDARTGTEQVWLVVESEPLAAADAARLCTAIVRAGMAIDVTIAHVELVPPRWLVKSSAGKLSRAANRARLLEEGVPA